MLWLGSNTPQFQLASFCSLRQIKKSVNQITPPNRCAKIQNTIILHN